mgnify:CR=1 FL=1
MSSIAPLTPGVTTPLGASGGAAAPGLVLSETSDTPAPDILQVDGYQARHRRMRAGVLATGWGIQRYMSDCGHRYKAAFLTLTYADQAGWSPRDISEFLKRVRQWADRRGVTVRGVWKFERGTKSTRRIHYHLLLFLPKGFTLPKPDKQGWWRRGSTKIEWARSGAGYLAKYVSKPGAEDLPLPKGARLWGAVNSPSEVRAAASWAMAPGWLRELVPEGTRVTRRGSWWRCHETGAYYRTPWEFIGLAGGRANLRRRPGGVQCAWPHVFFDSVMGVFE